MTLADTPEIDRPNGRRSTPTTGQQEAAPVGAAYVERKRRAGRAGRSP